MDAVSNYIMEKCSLHQPENTLQMVLYLIVKRGQIDAVLSN